MIALTANAQSIVKVNSETAAKLKWNEWVKVSNDKAIYTINFGAGSSSFKPQIQGLSIKENEIIVLVKVPQNKIGADDYKLYPPVYIEIDTKQHPNYAKMAVFYRESSIEFYEGMQQDLDVWKTQVRYISQANPEYNADKHLQVVNHFVENFKFVGTRVYDLNDLLSEICMGHRSKWYFPEGLMSFYLIVVGNKTMVLNATFRNSIISIEKSFVEN
jgi:hypothetical protein